MSISDSHTDMPTAHPAPATSDLVGRTVRAVADPSLLIASGGLACLFTVNQGMRITTLTGIYPVDETLIVRHALAALVLIAIALVLWRNSSARIMGSRIGYGIIGALLSVAVVARYSSLFMVDPPLPVELTGKLTEEALCCALIVLWAHRVLRNGLAGTCATVAYALLIQAALQLILSFFQRIPCVVALSLLSLVSIGLYCLYARRSSRETSSEATPEKAASTTPEVPLITMRLAAVIIFCLSFILGGIIFESLEAQNAMANDPLAQLCIIGGNVIGAFILIFSISRINNHAYCAIFLMGCFACCAVTLYLTTFLVNEAVGAYLIASSIGLQGTVMFIWYSPFLTGGKPTALLQRYTALYSVYLCAKVLSASCMLLNRAAYANLFSILISLGLLGLFCCCTFVVARSLNAPKPTVVHGGAPLAATTAEPETSSLGPDTAPSPSAVAEQRDVLEESVEALANEYGLTRQEHRVLLLLAKGLNAGAISDKMVVSINTTKSHMRNIYAKMNVHSQQEIIALVHEQEAISRDKDIA